MAVIIPSNHFVYKQFIKHVLCAIDIDQLNLHPVTFQQYNATCYWLLRIEAAYFCVNVDRNLSKNKTGSIPMT